MLPELGVTEKKTHSSSIDEPVAEIIRQRVQGGAGAAMRREADTSVAVAEPEFKGEPSRQEQPARHEQAVRHEPFARQEPAAPAAPGQHVARTPVPEFEAPAPASAAAPEQEAPVTTPASLPGSLIDEPLRSKPAPLRPPLSAGGSAAPLHPPLRTGPVPARPVPTPRPGQILSGPRQPLPAPTSGSPAAAAVGDYSGPTCRPHRTARKRNVRASGEPHSRNAFASAAAPKSRGTAGSPFPWCPRAPTWWRACSNSRLVRRLGKFSSKLRGPACRRAAPLRFPASPSIAAPFVPASP